MDNWNPKRVILPFTFGKDSLLSMVTLRELGYEVIPVNIDERILPRGKAIREKLEKDFKKEHDISCHIVENEIQLLTDYQVLEQPETRLYQVHVHFVYLLAMMPFCYYYNAPTIVFSNEFHHSLDRMHKDGYICPHKYMQSRETVNGFDKMTKTFSDGQISAVNLIGVLDNFAIHRILHEKFSEFGKYRISCHIEMTDHQQWCHDCNRCAQAFVFFLAEGIDPLEKGFEASMLTEDKKNHFTLFNDVIHPDDKYRQCMADEDGLAFLMAYQNGAKGPLMDLFQKTHLAKVKKQEFKLRKKVFSLYDKPRRHSIEKEAAKLYQKYFKTL